jgi:cyclic AMP-dependent transcription factor ATF-2
MDTRFDVDHASPGSDIGMPLNGQMHELAPSNYATFVNKTVSLSTKSRCNSLQSNFESYPPTTPQIQSGRRRGSEYAEPGSARAIYLEKNRKAASKCRSKQKRQREKLVETAREVERQNKILKAEVKILQNGMRDLMELVGRHSECPDARIKLYVIFEYLPFRDDQEGEQRLDR